jgi:hypothetical protein
MFLAVPDFPVVLNRPVNAAVRRVKHTAAYKIKLVRGVF